MQLLSCHDGKLLKIDSADLGGASAARSFSTRLNAVDRLLPRPRGAGSIHHAAATRWLVEPARGERTVQRWKIQLIHGHGGRLHQPVYLEYSRDWRQPETHRVRATDQLGDRAVEKETVVA